MTRSATSLLAAASFVAPSLAQEPQPLLGAPVPGLTPAQLERFEAGLLEFETPITEAQGLGPVFNGVSCIECHNHPAAGGFGERTITRFARADPFSNLGNLGGSLLQEFSIDPQQCIEVIPPQADHVIQRGTPPLFGSGLMEGVQDADIMANEANQPAHLSGIVRLSQPLEDQNGPVRIGRFGWKVNQATVMSFTIGAARNEMGLTSSWRPDEHAPQGDQDLLDLCDNVADPEDLPDNDGITRIDRWRDFQRFLAAPPQTPRSGHSGELVFETIGCADCHRAEYITAPADEAALSGQVVRPYSNFLLHDMGALADGMKEGTAATQDEMGTRGLWGMRHRTALLHDGRSSGGTFEQNAEDAILQHDGEALFSVTNYQALSNADKDRLLAFLGTLGQAEFDLDTDNDRDLADWSVMLPLMTGPAPAQSITPDDLGALADVDQDGDFDLHEFGQFQQAFGVPAPVQDLAATSLDLRIRSGSTGTLTVSPGATVDYRVVGELSDSNTQGLALFSLDLTFDGGALTPASSPTNSPMAEFDLPLGLTNPTGFGGTPSGGDLLQVGGGQNTIGNTLAAAPTGTVLPGVALDGSPVNLVRGSLTAPTTPGTYTLTAQNIRANVLAAGSTGTPFWQVQRTSPGSVSALTIIVDGAATYCDATPNSVSPGGTQLTSLGGYGTTQAEFLITDAPNQPGILFVGPDQISVPFGCGNRCVGGQIIRYSPVFPMGNQVQTTIDMTLLGPNHTNTQYWYRDPAGCSGNGGFNLSNAIGL